MKNTNKLTDLTLDGLNARKKKLTGVIIGLGIVMLIADVILLYIAFTKEGMQSLAIVALCTSISFLPAVIGLSQVNEELKKRRA